MDENLLELSVPVICTRGVVLFPGQDIVIEVGRDKSINALEEAQKSFDGHVWVVCQKDILVENPTIKDIYQVGTLCMIKDIKQRNGFKRVTFSGIKRAEIIKINEDEKMFFATVRMIEEIKGDSMEEMALIRRIAKEIETIAADNNRLPKEIVMQLAKGVSAQQLADQFAQYYPLPIEKKQELLETYNINDRLMKVIQEMEYEKELAVIETGINDKVKEKIDEGQKEYYLRERLKAIKEELGDVSSSEDDSDMLRDKIMNNPYPEHVKTKALDELKRYETLPASTGESGVIRNYLDWLLDTPWYQQSTDNKDLNLANQILDEDHYGLQKVKERIMEYLAVKNMTNSLNAPILCLVGPPGTGKTSLGKSIARALNRKFVKASLGGVRDEAEIRGHRRTYLGSMPGRIIQGMKRAGVMNPVFLIDEIDKMGSDYKGDPSSAMLEVLDPEQNSLFSDHYLEEPYDLSKVMFIATANYLENIPDALRDRLEIINLSSYTEEEKVHIAIDHLIPKQIATNGLKESQIKIGEEELLHLVRHYTREAGVRQLERVISTLCRKTVLEILKNNKKSIRITKKQITEWLGKEIFEFGTREKENQIGVATGLAYTSFGGDVLPVEVTTFEGKGNLIITGQLGDVMKESVEIALGYVKSNAAKYHIDPLFFEKHDIHLHVPEGAVPKDGPSAGITLTTAIISALTHRAVYSNLAMTGEVTLRGNVLPIGGLKEKTMAAHRCGIETVLIPKQNMKDMDEIPDSVKNSLKILPVESMDQVLKKALV
ncbi:MAG: endopeptidase La [Erysipelotrichaceae bacterium]|nr:endopeptidase La [Erysipelotrichaceae bacterium]